MEAEGRLHNKAFKRDSCRAAFLVCGNFGGERALRKVGLGGIRPLTRRYVGNWLPFVVLSPTLTLNIFV
ncbi:DUF3265 domain-containing protein [Vibrio furnissii]|nr:DUF3265 domain-containing protein [Vibrio furnissii]